MKNRSQLFSFMLEMIIVIFFFALASMVCASFLANSKKKVNDGKQLQESLLEAHNMINIMQSHSQQNIEELFDVTKENDHYQYHNLIIHISKEEHIKTGTITINDDIQIQFVIGGYYEE